MKHDRGADKDVISIHDAVDHNQVNDPRVRKRIYLLSGILLISALAVLPYDSTLAHPAHLDSIPGDLGRFITLSEFFAHGFGVLVVAIGIWTLAPQFRRFLPRIAACAFWPALIVNVLKLGFGRRRPITFFDQHSQPHFPQSLDGSWLGWLPSGITNTDYPVQSFPSAHAATAWGFAIGLSWVFPRGKWLFFSMAILASIQRVTSFAHWPSDVLMGAAIGVCFGAALLHDWGLGRWLNRFEAWAALRQSSTRVDCQREQGRVAA